MNETNEVDKRCVQGKTLLTVCIAVYSIMVFSTLAANFALGEFGLFALLAAVVDAVVLWKVYNGSKGARYFEMVRIGGGIILNLITLTINYEFYSDLSARSYLYVQGAEGTLRMVLILGVFNLIVAAAFLFVLGCSQTIKEFQYSQLHGLPSENSRKSAEQQAAWEREQEKTRQKPCPACGQHIDKESPFCRFCGVDVAAKEREDAQALRQKMEQLGAGALFDEKTMENAKLYRKLYGLSVATAHLNEKAKELGLSDVHITPEEAERLIASPGSTVPS